jgi:hypothetical protein
MSFTPSVRRRLGGGLVLAAAAALVISSLSSVPAGAAVTGSSAGCPTFTVDNPAPGAQINAGKYVVSGAAFDPSAPAGTVGVNRVEFFLGFRESGGISLGSAVPGQTTAPAPGQPATTSSRLGGFSVELDFGSISRGDNLVGYAYASNSGAVTTVAIPVLINTQPTPTPTGGNNTPVVPRATTSSSNCTTGGAAPAAVSQPAAPPAAVQGGPVGAVAPAGAAPPAPVGGVSGGKPVLRLDNPRPGDLLPVGHTILSGVAFDPAAPSGSGVDRVEFFDRPREAGGIFLGGGAPGTTGSPDVFNIEVNVNSNQTGSTTLYAYAHSSVTGQQTVVSVPIFLGAPPTATPRT